VNGPILACAAFLLIAGSATLWFRSIQAVRIPKNRIPFLATWMIGALMGVVALSSGGGWLVGIPATLAVLGGLFFTLSVGISAQRVASDVITVGSMLPEFTAQDENGEPFSSASLAGNPVLIKFFRAHW
jgi:hypothetical protein